MKENLTNIESTIDREKQEKISKLEKLDIGPMQKAEIMLLVLGYKPATELDLYEHNDDVEKVRKVLEDVGLKVKGGKLLYSKYRVARLFIAVDEDNLNKIAKLDPSKDHEEYGRLMRYPSTAIEAFLNKELLLLDEDYPDMRDIIFPMKLSRDHWQDELKVLKEWSEAIRKYSPKTYAECRGRESVDDE